jgi:mannose-6-phosphate isomerase-like protein (cupin superfamily)
MRMLSMRATRSFVRASFIVIAGGSAHADAVDKVAYVSAADLKAAVAQTADGIATYQMKGPSTVVVIARRDRPGEVEVHVKMNDIIVVQEGHATVLIGDRVEGGRETAPNEWRGGKILGGRTYNLAAGDMLWIPAGLGHQMTVTPGGSFSYVVVKTEAKAPTETSK